MESKEPSHVCMRGSRFVDIHFIDIRVASQMRKGCSACITSVSRGCSWSHIMCAVLWLAKIACRRDSCERDLEGLKGLSLASILLPTTQITQQEESRDEGGCGLWRTNLETSLAGVALLLLASVGADLAS